MRKTDGKTDSAIDWRLTTWEGARREQLRRWAALPLERFVAALEEMQELAEWLSPTQPVEENSSGTMNR